MKLNLPDRLIGTIESDEYSIGGYQASVVIRWDFEDQKFCVKVENEMLKTYEKEFSVQQIESSYVDEIDLEEIFGDIENNSEKILSFFKSFLNLRASPIDRRKLDLYLKPIEAKKYARIKSSVKDKPRETRKTVRATFLAKDVKPAQKTWSPMKTEEGDDLEEKAKETDKKIPVDEKKESIHVVRPDHKDKWSNDYEAVISESDCLVAYNVSALCDVGGSLKIRCRDEFDRSYNMDLEREKIDNIVAKQKEILYTDYLLDFEDANASKVFKLVLMGLHLVARATDRRQKILVWREPQGKKKSTKRKRKKTERRKSQSAFITMKTKSPSPSPTPEEKKKNEEGTSISMKDSFGPYDPKYTETTKWALVKNWAVQTQVQKYTNQLLENPHDITACVALGMLYYRHGNMKESSGYLFKAQQIDRNSDLCTNSFWVKLGRSQYRMWELTGEISHLEQAQNAYHEALKAFENSVDPDIWFESGIVTIKFGNFEKAATLLETIIQSFPHFDRMNECYFCCAICLKYMNMYDSALEYFKCVVDNPPGPYFAEHIYFQVADVSRLMKDEKQAKKYLGLAFKELQKKHRDGGYHSVDGWINSADTFEYFANVYSSGRDNLLAVECYRDALAKGTGKNPAILYSYSLALHACRQINEAVAAVKKALSIAPKNIALKETLAKWEIEAWTTSFERSWDELEEMATQIQSVARGKNARNQMKQKQEGATKIQAVFRGRSERLELLHKKNMEKRKKEKAKQKKTPKKISKSKRNKLNDLRNKKMEDANDVLAEIEKRRAKFEVKALDSSEVLAAALGSENAGLMKKFEQKQKMDKRKAATKIQSVFRGSNVRRSEERLESALGKDAYEDEAFKKPDDVFMEDPGQLSSFFKRESVKQLNTYGYVSGTTQYLKYWRNVLKDVKHHFKSKRHLKKSLAEVQVANPGASEQEAFCALADSRGDVAAASSNLKHGPFIEEVKAMCKILDVTAYASGKQPFDGIPTRGTKYMKSKKKGKLKLPNVKIPKSHGNVHNPIDKLIIKVMESKRLSNSEGNFHETIARIDNWGLAPKYKRNF
eukprot:g4204.t1